MLAGADFVSLREEGRWVADASLRVYLDAVATAALSVSEVAQSHAAVLTRLEASFVDYFGWWPASGLQRAQPWPLLVEQLAAPRGNAGASKAPRPSPPMAVCLRKV
eukprot:6590867-Lingulodinium_polyedra.AAC.1